MANIKINRGTTFSIGVNYSKDGVATSLVGSTVRFTIKSDEYDSDLTDASALVTKNVTDGDGTGYAQVTLSPSDTQALTPGDLYYDLKIDEASDGVSVYKIDEGTIELDGSPTNRLA